jgi:hypothetical protein
MQSFFAVCVEIVFFHIVKGISINCFVEILRFMLSRFLCGRREHSELCDRLTIKKIKAENQNITKVPMLPLYIV